MSAWAAYASGQPAAGDLIQIPDEGLGISIPMDNSASTANGALVLNDDDLCGVLSGKLTDFPQLLLCMGSAKPTADTITVSVRFDAMNGLLVLTDHRSTVCTMRSGGSSDITFTATSTFFSLSGGTLPGNFVGETGDAALATEIKGTSPLLSYFTPECATVDPNSGLLINGAPPRSVAPYC